MIYVYGCSKCRRSVEVSHQMKFVGDEKSLPKEILKQISCRHGIMKRVPQEVQLMGMSGGSSKTESELRKDKQIQRKKRSRLHFKNEVASTIADKDSREYFKRKIASDPVYKDLKGDHEKIK